MEVGELRAFVWRKEVLPCWEGAVSCLTRVPDFSVAPKTRILKTVDCAADAVADDVEALGLGMLVATILSFLTELRIAGGLTSLRR